jgi:GxxExxY protein
MPEVSRGEIERTASEVVDSIIKVHRSLGPGLLESAYQACLAHELTSRGHRVTTEVILPIEYEGMTIDRGYRLDMLINDQVLVENKSVSALTNTHHAQVITYLKLSGLKLGLLVNWNVVLVKNGIKRVALAL